MTSASTGGVPVLEALNVTMRFGGLTALDDVSIVVPTHSTVGLIGPNGAGKSTLFAVMSGVIHPTRGSVRLHDRDVTRHPLHRRARAGLARTFQHPELYGVLTVREHLALARRMRFERRRLWSDLFDMRGLRSTDRAERTAVDELLDMLTLGDVADRKASSLPLGQGRLLEVGRAVMSSPNVLMLDEPSAGLDPRETERLTRTLALLYEQMEFSLLLVEHDLDMVLGLSQLIYTLDFGRLIATGTPDEIRRDPAVRAAYLGEDPLTETVESTS